MSSAHFPNTITESFMYVLRVVSGNEAVYENWIFAIIIPNICEQVCGIVAVLKATKKPRFVAENAKKTYRVQIALRTVG